MLCGQVGVLVVFYTYSSSRSMGCQWGRAIERALLAKELQHLAASDLAIGMTEPSDQIYS